MPEKKKKEGIYAKCMSRGRDDDDYACVCSETLYGLFVCRPVVKVKKRSYGMPVLDILSDSM
jgi:hypothetical protein